MVSATLAGLLTGSFSPPARREYCKFEVDEFCLMREEAALMADRSGWTVLRTGEFPTAGEFAPELSAGFLGKRVC